MPSFRQVALACALFTLCGIAHAGGASTLDILSLTDSPDPLATGQTSTINAEVRYFAVGHDVGTPHISIDHLVRVNATVVNPAGTTIRTLASEFSAERPAGQLPGLRTKSVSMLWDGKDEGGAAVPADTYTYKVQAQRLIRFTFSLCGQLRVEEVVIHQSGTKLGTITVSGVQDETPPLIADFAPTNGAWTTQTRPPLSASFSDDSSGVDPGSVEVLLDGLPVTVAAGTDGFTFTPSADLAQGSHTVSISVSDLAGNAANAAWTFSVDTLPPSITDLQPAHGVFLNSPRPAVSAAFSDGASGIGVDAASVIVYLDGLDVTAQALVTPEGVTYQPTADLVEGAHQLIVQVSDLLGQNAQGSSGFTLDVSPPVISGLSPAHNLWQNAVRPAVSAAFSDGMGIGVDPLSVVITLNGVDVTGSAQVDAAGFVFTPDADLAQGPHSVTVSVADALGNTATASATFKVDSVPPVIADLVPTTDGAIREALPTLSGSFTETGSGVDAATFGLSLDDAPTGATAEATGFSYTLTEALGEGLHSARAVVRDLAGNQTAAEWSFTIDTVQPSIVDLVVSPAGITNNPQPLFSASFSDTGSDAGVDPSRVRILLDGVDVSEQGVITALGFTFTPGTALAEGPHVLSVRIEDAAGNATEATAIVDVDVTAPTIDGINDVVAEAIIPEGVDVYFTGVSAQDTRSGIKSLEFNPHNGSVLPLGVSTVNATAIDNAGNISLSTFSVIVVDTTPPKITPHPDIEVVATSAAGSVVNYDNAIVSDATTTIPSITYSHPSGSQFPVGQTTVLVTATDFSGNQATESFVITVQTPSRIEVFPSEVTIARNGSQQFFAVVYDAFELPLNPQPHIIWSVNGGTGTISEAGLYTTDQAPVGIRAGGIGGEDEGVGVFTVEARFDEMLATALVTVQPSTFTVEFIRPEEDARFLSPADIVLDVSAVSDPAPVERVEFFASSYFTSEPLKIGETQAEPHSLTWTGVTPGIYSVEARATNSEGAVQSDYLSVWVNYSIIDVSLLNASYSEAWSINSHRQVVGFSFIPDQGSHAFLWEEGQSTSIGPGQARGINDSSEIVGQSRGHATVWHERTPTDLDEATGPYADSLAHSINGLSTAVGWQKKNGFSHTGPTGAAFWKGPGTHLLTNGTDDEALAINDLGLIGGNKGTHQYKLAVVWDGGEISYVTTGPVSRGASVHGMNNKNELVGHEGELARLWHKRSGKWEARHLDIPSAIESSRAYSINDSGDVVGFIEDIVPRRKRAIAWFRGGSRVELSNLIPQDSGWELIEARGINANGDIVGFGIKDGVTRGFLLSTGLSSDTEHTLYNLSLSLTRNIVVLNNDFDESDNEETPLPDNEKPGILNDPKADHELVELQISNIDQEDINNVVEVSITKLGDGKVRLIAYNTTTKTHTLLFGEDATATNNIKHLLSDEYSNTKFYIEGVAFGRVRLQLLVNGSPGDICTFDVLDLSVDVPPEIDSDTHQFFVSSVFTPSDEPNLVSSVKDLEVEYAIFEDGIKKNTLSGRINSFGANAVPVNTSAIAGKTYSVLVTAAGNTIHSNKVTVIPGSPHSMSVELEKELLVADEADATEITLNFRDTANSPIEDGTSVSFILEESLSDFVNHGQNNQNLSLEGKARALLSSHWTPTPAKVQVRSGRFVQTVSIPHEPILGSINCPSTVSIDEAGSVDISLTTNARNGAEAHWLISNIADGEAYTTSSVVNDGQTRISIPLNSQSRLGDTAVLCNIGLHTFSQVIRYESSGQFKVLLDRFVISGDKSSNGSFEFDRRSVRLFSGVPTEGLPPSTASIDYHTASDVILEGAPNDSITIESLSPDADQYVSLLDQTDNPILGNVFLDTNGIALFQIKSKGILPTREQEEFSRKSLRFRLSSLLSPQDSFITTINLVQHDKISYFADSFQSFFGGDPETTAGIVSNAAGGILIVGDVGALVKNAWRAMGFSNKEVDLWEVSLSGIGLATELAVGVGEAADVPISFVRAVVVGFGKIPFTQALVVLTKRAIQNGQDIADLGRFLATLFTKPARALVVKEVLTSERLLKSAIQITENLGDDGANAFLDAMLRIGTDVGNGGVDAAKAVTALLDELPDGVLASLRTSGKLEDALVGLARGIKNGVDPELALKILNNDILGSGYEVADLLIDIGRVADAPGFDRLAKTLANTGSGRFGFLFELQVASHLSDGTGRNLTYLSKYIDNAFGKTDIDVVLGATAYQAKRSRAAIIAGAKNSMEALKKLIAWIAKAKADGAQKVVLIVPQEATIPTVIQNWISKQKNVVIERIMARGRAIPDGG
ncbi:MAG: HYR domain-containing protein [Planctomycetes bacterium]|nr:HYR domain-containing protein [Planctomycetota bacterium]